MFVSEPTVKVNIQMDLPIKGAFSDKMGNSITLIAVFTVTNDFSKFHLLFGATFNKQHEYSILFLFSEQIGFLREEIMIRNLKK